MSNSRTYSPISPAQFQTLQGGLVSRLQQGGAQNIAYSGGNPGTVSFQANVPSSDGKFAFNYNYSAQTQSLYVQITNSPWMISNDTILDAVGKQINAMVGEPAPAVV